MAADDPDDEQDVDEQYVDEQYVDEQYVDEQELDALEAQVPWQRADFRIGLAVLTTGVAVAAKAFADEARTLTELAAMVPRTSGDERGGTAWTSFCQEIAVARSVSNPAAAADISRALRLTSTLPQTLTLLDTGRITVSRARAFLDCLQPYDDVLARQLDADLADRIARLAVWRIKDEVRRAAIIADPDSAALHTATATAKRDVTFSPDDDGQACVIIKGPAVPLTRWYATLDQRARALRAAGDPRNLAALRFDLTVSAFPCLTHLPADTNTDLATTAPALLGTSSSNNSSSNGGSDRSGSGGQGDPQAAQPNNAPPAAAQPDAAPPGAAPSGAALAGLRPSGVEAASTDCRTARPAQAVILVPVETALGLSNEPGWLDGYGWLDAPTTRQLLPDAELRQMCTDKTTGQVLDLAPRPLRPPPTPTGVRDALLPMVTAPTTPHDTAWRTEPRHDPSPSLRDFTALRDRTCDGPTQPRTAAQQCDRDHQHAYPTGPTAAWNLTCRSRRTHQLKHYGWTPTRTATGTTWTSPAGQVVDVPNHNRPAPGIDDDPEIHTPTLPDPDQLAATDAAQLTPLADDESLLVVPQDQGLAVDDATKSDIGAESDIGAGSDIGTAADDEPPF